MNDLEKLIIVVYLVYPLICTPIIIHGRHKEKVSALEDKTAIATTNLHFNEKSKRISGFAALDKSKDGKIDEIREYSLKFYSGGRASSWGPGTDKYHPGDKRFEEIRHKYFSQLEYEKK